MEYKINHLPQKYDDVIMPLLNINDKLVLGGSLSLYIMNIMKYDFTQRVPDVDMGLKGAIVEEDLSILCDFFNLNIKHNQSDDYDIIPDINNSSLVSEFKTKPVSHFVNRELIQLEKYHKKTDTVEYIVDLFNSQYLKPKDIIHIPYNDHIIRLTHPSVILSYKSKYAYDTRVGKQYKHFKDIQDINWDNYFKIVKQIGTVYENSKLIHSCYLMSENNTL